MAIQFQIITMPNIEEHARFCVQTFGEENRELCYMVNSWIDSPVRSKGKSHRDKRHDALSTPFQAIRHYGDMKHGSDPKNLLVARMVLQHLRLDGVITPYEEKHWMSRVRWKRVSKNLKAKIERLEREESFSLLDLLGIREGALSSEKGMRRRISRHCSLCGKKITLSGNDSYFETLENGQAVCQECLDNEKDFSLIENIKRTHVDEANSTILPSETMQRRPQTEPQSSQSDVEKEAMVRLEELRRRDKERAKSYTILSLIVCLLFFAFGIYGVTQPNPILIGTGIVAIIVFGLLLLFLILSML